ncbi:MAG TPA: ABC transporter ATP-binding protein [Puia sp.]|nr:ABC transporter ATP-binding protein [Puia sp.]
MKDSRTTGSLLLDKVAHGYNGLQVIQEVNLAVEPGELVVLVGPSGCGKTTLLNLLSGFLTPVSGTVRTEGLVRTVYQQDGLFPWLTVAENIGMGLRGVADKARREQELRELLELIHLERFRDHYPHQLSGGMRQRVELARVVAGDSDILLMDEPFSALDYQTRIRMRQELGQLLEKRPRTVVFVTHDIEEAAVLADRVLVLSQRPTRIVRELSVHAPRPRNPTDDVVVEASRAILEELGLQVHR